MVQSAIVVHAKQKVRVIALSTKSYTCILVDCGLTDGSIYFKEMEHQHKM